MSATGPSTGLVVKVVVVTAASTLLIAGIIFYFVYRYAMARERRRSKFVSSFRREAATDHHRELAQHGRVLKKMVVDDNGTDVLYLQKLEAGQFGSFSTIWFNPLEGEEKWVNSRGEKPDMSEPVQQIPLFHDTSNAIQHKKTSSTTETSPPPTPPPPSPPPRAPHPPPQLPSPPTPSTPPPPPPPPSPRTPLPEPMKRISWPAPPKVPAKRNPLAPPPPQTPSGSVSSTKPPIAPKGKINSNSRTEVSTEKNSKGNGGVQLKMKPLHWDKVSTNVDHSLVWKEIDGGSFRFDDELIETLFGYNDTNHSSPEKKNISSASSTPPAKIFILDTRKSQNTAIVLKSLAFSRKEILDALLEGHGLNTDTLEKLTKISPTKEEATKILQFNNNPARLANAESFLYYILKSVPSAFIRINAMLFRSNYDPEILHLKESLQALEFGCKELRGRGLFFKLLEAILKAGNRMNAGTARGDAQGFNLNALRKLSHVKSTDRKTNLLHFVVEQVARAEGKRCMINKIQISTQDSDSQNKENRDREHLMLGLSIFGNLNTDFSNVKKVATLDPESVTSGCPNLILRVIEIQQLVTRCGNDERSGFVKEMKGFIEECEEELKVVTEEQKRVMQLVKRTTEFYQAGASKDKGAHPFEIFIFIKDFLDMVDQTCSDIMKKFPKKEIRSVESSLLISPSTRASVIFQNQKLQSYFLPEKPRSTSFRESEDDF